MNDIKIDKFEGPLSLLLKIIEKEELDITSVNLARIADEYLEYIKKSSNILPESMADFLLMATKLLYIKSKALLPYLFTDEDQEELEDLEEKLKMYKDFVDLSNKIKKIIGKKKFSFFRTSIKNNRRWFLSENSFFPPQNIKVENLKKVFSKILSEIKFTDEKLEQRTISAEINIEERIIFLKNMVIDKIKVNFSRILKESNSKVEIIVNFLAVLELAKQREVVFDQSDLFGEIFVEKYKELNN